jgi:hypothetical protein
LLYCILIAGLGAFDENFAKTASSLNNQRRKTIALANNGPLLPAMNLFTTSNVGSVQRELSRLSIPSFRDDGPKSAPPLLNSDIFKFEATSPKSQALDLQQEPSADMNKAKEIQ